MARMFPRLSESQLDALQSKGEAMFYRACLQQLPERLLVLHSIPLVWHNCHGTPSDGEADFIIFDPTGGVLIIEVKGGGVRIDPSDEGWTSIGRNGIQHKIKNPFKQVVAEKYAILGQLREHPAWQKIGAPRIILGHAVFLPDVEDLDVLAAPHRPLHLLGGRRDLQAIDHWLTAIYAYWAGGDGRARPLGEVGMAVIEEIFCKPVEARPLASLRLQDEEQARIRFTSQQARLLRSLSGRVRAAVCGGAGTGKTILALEKAKQAAASGLETLLLCYNRPLADHLRQLAGSTAKLSVMSFHQLCDWRARIVKTDHRRDVVAEARREYPSGDHFEDVLPFALCLTCDNLDQLYDAIIIDEAQDYSDSFWMPIELLLRDTDKSSLYVFFDQNQAVYRKQPNYPVQERPFLLTVNCRNTRHIHEAAYRFFRGDQTDPCEIEGVPVQQMVDPLLPQQARLIAHEVVELIGQNRVPASEIVILIAGDLPDIYYDQLQRLLLPNGSRWAFRQRSGQSQVLIDTVRRFKGLEAGIVFLWGIDAIDVERERELVYVGTSRAKSRLYLVGSSDACRQIVEAASNNG